MTHARTPRLFPTTIRGTLVFLLLLVLVPVLLAQGCIYYRWFLAQKTSELDSNLEVARAVATAFDSYVDDVLSQELDIGLLCASPRNADPALIRELMDAGLRSYPSLRDFSWVGPDGRVGFSTHADAVGTDLSNRPYFRAIASGKDHAVSNLILDRAPGQPFFVIAQGVRNSEGHLEGVVAATVEPDRFGDALPIRREPGAAFGIIDRAGHAVYRFPLGPPGWRQRNWLQGRPGIAKALRGHDVVGTGPSLIGEADRVYGMTPISSIGWAVTAGQPARVVTKALSQNVLVEGGLLLLVAFGALWGAVKVSRVIAVPMAHLCDQAVALGGGELDRRGEIGGPMELRQLGQCFNQMAERLQRREAELDEARKAAEAASRAKSEFLANVSHEIRTPMNAILGLTDLVRHSGLTPEQDRYLGLVKGSADSLLQLINDILDISKIEAGKLELSREPFDLPETVEDAVRSLGFLAHRKGLELVCHLYPAVPAAVEGDPGRLRQVLVNLVGNAVKFTESGQVIVRVQAPDPADGSGFVLVSVEDTGIGIPEDGQSVLFRTFSQVDGSATRRHGGTGLGLAISRRIVEAMGGRIWVESTVGVGSTFSFTVPLPPAPARPQAQDLSLLRGARVLVVDDNAASREALRALLTDWETVATEASGGEEALDLAAQAARAGKPFSLALLDCEMPGMDGFSVAVRMAERVDPFLPVVMVLTSRDVQGHTSRCRAMGIPASIVKPVKRSELLNALLAVLDPQKVQAVSAPAPAAPEGSREEVAEGLRVLLAEDNATNQLLARALLERKGWEVVIASDGEEALRALEADSFDVVLMDVQMPGLDGLEATQIHRRREKSTSTGRIPIIGLTAHAMAEDRDRCLEAGMDDYLAKPFDPEALWATVARWARGKSAAPSEPELEEAPAALSKVLRGIHGDVGILRKLVASFLQDYGKKRTSLGEAIEAGDAGGLERTAHSLRGALTIFGAARAAGLASKLETLGKEGRVREAVPFFRRLEEEIERLIAFLTKQADVSLGADIEPTAVPEGSSPEGDPGHP